MAKVRKGPNCASMGLAHALTGVKHSRTLCLAAQARREPVLVDLGEAGVGVPGQRLLPVMPGLAVLAAIERAAGARTKYDPIPAHLRRSPSDTVTNVVPVTRPGGLSFRTHHRQRVSGDACCAHLLGSTRAAWIFVMTTKTLTMRTGPTGPPCSPWLTASLRRPTMSRAQHRHLTEQLHGASVHVFSSNLFVPPWPGTRLCEGI